MFKCRVNNFSHTRNFVCFVLGNRGCTKTLSVHSNAMQNPVERQIRQKLTSKFETTYLEIKNESYMHSVPKDSETHFKVVVVSDKFESLPLIKRHRLVNDTLAEELKSGVHALSIVAKTPSEWGNSNKMVSGSPACMGGFGK